MVRKLVRKEDIIVSFDLTILTPTYNRKALLQRLYDSLCKQTKFNFQWLVIDDGSTDGTDKFFRNINTGSFSIEYYWKKNGGKHTALNFAHPYIKGELVIIVDSDDYLSIDAVETIVRDWEKYKSNLHIAILSYLKESISQKKLLSNSFAVDGYISDHIAYRVNHNIKGDMAEVVKADVFKSYKFPVFENEYMLSEEWLWNHIAMEYKTVYRKKVIYYCDYIEGGLTKSGRKLLLSNPLGQMEACKSYFNSKVNHKMQMKKMLLYDVYGLCSNTKIKNLLIDSGRSIRLLLIMPFALILYFYWIRKCFHE